MEEAKDLGMSSVCVSDEPNIEDIKSGKFHLIFGSAENVLKSITRRTCTVSRMFRSYLRFSKSYADENTTIRFSIKIYTNS